mmetsp:Transcript_13538/g.29702  ORF Transcript_13538/g.29702 Transcript_13538/m.29702 type:complete len:216 (-) Transcript_13538:756-1403(-)
MLRHHSVEAELSAVVPHPSFLEHLPRRAEFLEHLGELGPLGDGPVQTVSAFPVLCVGHEQLGVEGHCRPPSLVSQHRPPPLRVLMLAVERDEQVLHLYDREAEYGDVGLLLALLEQVRRGGPQVLGQVLGPVPALLRLLAPARPLCSYAQQLLPLLLPHSLQAAQHTLHVMLDEGCVGLRTGGVHEQLCAAGGRVRTVGTLQHLEVHLQQRRAVR